MPFQITGLSEAKAIRKIRPIDAHKGSMGHAALIAGSYGMLGAAILSARACLRSGVGKLSCFVSPQSYPILQSAVPEAIFQITETIENIHDYPFQSIGIGPGIGIHERHIPMLEKIFNLHIPLVLDADALNVMAAHKELIEKIPADTIITPHSKEFSRIFGENADPLERAKALHIYIILKGPHTLVATPEGIGYLNQSGNPGMATAGSGDVLTGIITGLLAQGYSPCDASRLGVYIHGLAGDLAVKVTGEEALIAGDLIEFIGKSFQQLVD
jgi:ADP-dependent NAD(P)H-hydrate dehydratase / NAD(P)H-hydrate epimerase